MTDKKHRTVKTVRIEIEILERDLEATIHLARRARNKVDLDARVRATGEVGKIDREYTTPAMREIRILRDKSSAMAKETHDAGLIRPVEEAMRNARADALSAYEAEVAAARKEHEEKVRPLREEMRVLEDASAKTRPPAQSDISYPSKSEIKREKPKAGVDA